MAAILTKIDEYKKTLAPEDSYSTQAEEIVKEFRGMLNSIREEHKDTPIPTEKIEILKNIYQAFPSQIMEYYSGEFFDGILDFSSDNIYRSCSHLNISIGSNLDFEFEIKQEDEFSIRIILDIIKKTSPKEVLLYIKNYYSNKKIKSFQKYFIIMELILSCIAKIDRKERFLKEMLPLLSRVLHKSLEKYVKFKGKLDRNEYEQTPIKIAQYQLHYENWIKLLISRILITLINIIQPSKNKLLTMNEIYVQNGNSYKKVTPEPIKLIHHFSLLFIFDLLEGLIDVKENNYFEDSDIFIEQIIDALYTINPSFQDYLYNFYSQNKLLLNDDTASVHNKRDESSLLISDYDKLTMYNPAGMALISLVVSRNKEGSLMKLEHKLKVLLNGFHELIKYTPQKKDLKIEILSQIKNLFDKNPDFKPQYDNLNCFGFSLHEFIYNLLDFIGGPVEENISITGVEIYKRLKSMLSEKALAKLIVQMIMISKNYTLSGFLISEFKAGVNALLYKASNENIHEMISPFSDIQILDTFINMGIDVDSKNYKDDIDLAGACINFLIPIFIKQINLMKVYKENPNQFKDSNSIFNPDNRLRLISMGEKVKSQEKKLVNDFDTLNQKMQEAKDNNAPDLQNLIIRSNQLFIVKSDIERVQELIKELKSY